MAIADWSSGAAMALPFSREGSARPADLISSGSNGLIRSAGAAMEEKMHKTAIGAGRKLAGNQGHGPCQITATAGYND
jgi:hypothetical protein